MRTWMLSLLACGPTPDAPSETHTVTVTVPAPTATGPIGPTSPGPTGTDPAGPQILSVSTNVTEITEGDRLLITAIVTDPDGIDDVIGGELLSEGGSTYGVFSTGAQEGAYALQLWWDDLHAVEAIEFEGGADRRVLARFYDAAGHTAQQVVTIGLTCELGAACDGTCVSLEDDAEHCGGCRAACPDLVLPGVRDESGVCLQRECVEVVACSPARTCERACTSAGLACDDDVALLVDFVGLFYSDDACEYDRNVWSHFTACDLSSPFDGTVTCLCVP